MNNIAILNQSGICSNGKTAKIITNSHEKNIYYDDKLLFRSVVNNVYDAYGSLVYHVHTITTCDDVIKSYYKNKILMFKEIKRGGAYPEYYNGDSKLIGKLVPGICDRDGNCDCMIYSNDPFNMDIDCPIFVMASLKNC